MADSNEPSHTAAKRKGDYLQGLPKRLRLVDSSASQPNSTWVSVSSSASGAHDPGPGNDVQNAVLSTTTEPLARPASTNPQTLVSDWNVNAREGPRARLPSTSHLGSSSMFNNINNMTINDGTFTIENNKVLVI